MINLQDYGFNPANHTIPSHLLPGRITEVHRERYKAVCLHGEVTAVLKGAFVYDAQNRDGFPAVGDFVLLNHNEQGDSTIAELLPRKSKFSRTDQSGHAAGYVKIILEQVVAANFDDVFILSSLNKDFNVNRIVRYISAAWQSGGQPVVVLTKADLTDHADEQIAAIQAVAPGVPVHAVSSHTGAGLDEPAAHLQPRRTLVFLGMSGVGKSSLLNALAGRVVMNVQDIREDDSRGRHTTTHRQLFMLPSGAMVIDTPGMRELGLWNADDGVSVTFTDVEELFANCKFSNCKHTTEPGCAVLAALADGSLSQAQWERYLAQRRETAFVENKTAYMRQKQAWHKQLSKTVKKMKGSRS